MFVLSLSNAEYLRKPANLKPSQCTPLFLSAYKWNLTVSIWSCRIRDAGACIHTHSQAAVLVTLLYDKTFEIQNQEMIKGVPRGDSRKNGYLGYFDRLVIPIIENTWATVRFNSNDKCSRGRSEGSVGCCDRRVSRDCGCSGPPPWNIWFLPWLFRSDITSLGEFLGTM